MNKPELFSESNAATYCPEDNKLRLYVGRVPRDEYDALRAEGWHTTPKQSEAGQGEFAATWTPAREDTAISYAGIIGDEDAGPAERAADRAERFTGYLGRRLGEAGEHADRYEGQDPAHGYQSAEKAERAAARHDRIADRAINAWDKAEYWERRTRRVIEHSLYVSAPGVRMGRIKKLESEARKAAKNEGENAREYAAWKKAEAMPDGEERRRLVYALVNTCGGWYEYKHPRPADCRNSYVLEHGTSLFSLFTDESAPITAAEACALWLARHHSPEEYGETLAARWARHYDLRLAYERQMLEGQGGRLEQRDIEPGGKLGGRLILKANKSNATGRVTSCAVVGPKVDGWTYKARNIPGTQWAEYTIETERLDPATYAPPTPESLAELAAIKATIKAAREETTPKAAPLVNPTEADAERLQSELNKKGKADNDARQIKAYGKVYTEYKPSTVFRMTQAQYSAYSKGSYGRGETRGLCKNCELEPRATDMWRPREKEEAERRGPAVCKIRIGSSDGSDYGARRVIVLTDKAQKALPVEVWPKDEKQTTPAVPCGYEVSPGRCSQPGTNSGTVPTHCANCDSGTAQAKAARAGIQAELFSEVGA